MSGLKPPQGRAVACGDQSVRKGVCSEFKSIGQAHRFLGIHATFSSLFNLRRHLVKAEH